MAEVQVLENFRAAYAVLEGRVQRALQIHLGDTTRLHEQRNQVLQFLQSAEHVCLILPSDPTYSDLPSSTCTSSPLPSWLLFIAAPLP